jgi:hypothetical protein
MKKLFSLITSFTLVFSLFSNRVIALTWTIEYSPSTTTNTDVIATITGFDEPGTVLLNNWWSPVYTFTDDWTFDFELSGDTTTATATATVNWIDKISPTANIEYDITWLTNQDVVATITWFSESITSLNATEFTFTTNGTFTFTYSDLAGNLWTTIAEVTWIDKTIPTANIEYDITWPTNTDVTAIITWFSEEITWLNQTWYIFTEDNTFLFTYQDLAGNTGETQAEVTRIDKIDPTFDWVTTGWSYGETKIITFSDNKPWATATLNGAWYNSWDPINGYGIYEFSVIDTAGNTSWATFNLDTTTPIITLLWDNPKYLEVFSPYSEAWANRDDNWSNWAVIDIQWTVDINILWTYTRDYFYFDGFHTGTAQREIIIQDTTSPIISLIWANPVTIERTNLYTEDWATRTDNYDGTWDVATILGTVNTNLAGTYTLTYQKTDSSSNIGQTTRIINIVDTVKPTASTIEYSITWLTNQNVIATITWFDEAITNLNETNHTFTENGTFLFTFEDPSGNTGELLATVDRIDKVPVTWYVEYSPASLTNQDVVATITWFNKTWVIIDISQNYTFTGNGTYSFTYRDLAGNTGETLAEVTWIDKTPPTASTIEYSITGLTNQDVIATITWFSESITGQNTSDYTFTGNGTFVFTFEDLAGNTGELEAEVTWIDKTPITSSIIYTKDELTNEDVIATITGFNKSNITISGWNAYTFTGNGAYLFEYQDLAGNTGESLATVTWIDKTMPTASLRYDPLGPSWTNGSVFVQVTWFTESITGLNQTDYLFVTNGTFLFTYRDLAGNTGTNEAIVSWIDITPPTVGQAFISAWNTGNNWATLYYNGIISIRANVNDAWWSDLDGSSCQYTLDNWATRNSAWFNTNYCEITNINPESDIQIAFRIADNATNSATGTTTTYLFDIIAPTTIANPNSGLSNTQININLNRTDSGIWTFSTTQYCIDTTDTCTPNIAWTTTTITGNNNEYTTKYLRYRSIDMLGNTENIQSNNYTIDKVLPILTWDITSYSNNARNTWYAKLGDTITMTFSTSRTLISLPTVYIVWGSNTSASVTDLWSNNYMATYTTKATDTDGQLQFLVTMQDLVWNIGTWTIDSVIFDQTNPAGINIIKPTTWQYANTSPFAYNITRSTWSESNFWNDAIKIEFSIDDFASSIVITWGTENNGSLAYAFDSIFNNMNAKIKITATDIPGNTTTIVGWSFTLDGTPPTDITLDYPGLYLKGSTAYTINRSWGIDNYPDNITLAYSTGGTYTNIATCIKTSNEQSCIWTTPVITHTGVSLKITSTDKAGFQKTATTPTFIVDRTAPSISLITTPTRRTTPITWSATASDAHAGLSGSILYKYNTPTAYTTTTCDTGTTIAPYFSGDGIWTGYACVHDKAGNVGVTTRTYRIDSTAPSIEMFTWTLYKNATFTMTATGFDATAGISGYQRTKLSGTGTITFWSRTTGTTTISASTNGTYTIQVKAIDRANNSWFTTFTLVWDNQAPTLTSWTISTGNSTATFSFFSNKTGTLLYSGACGNWTATNATNSWATITSWTLTNNTYSNCSIKITDSFGNYSRINVPSFTINYTAPSWWGGWWGWGWGWWFTPTPTCQLTDLICENWIYIKKSWVSCQLWELWNSCATETTGTTTNIQEWNIEAILSILTNTKTPELERAFIYSKTLGITDKTYNKWEMLTPITRSYLAKMMAIFAMNVLKKQPDTTKKCEFTDIAGFDQESQKYIKLACQLGIMGVDANKNPLKTFNPEASVTRAVFGTTLSRTMRWTKYNQDTNDRYQKHLETLQIKKIMKQIDKPQNRELRWYVMLMMMRTDLELLRKITTTTPTTLPTPIPNILNNIPTIQQNSEISTTQPQPITQPQPTTENSTPTPSQIQLTTQTDITRTDAEKAFISKINKNYQFTVGFKRDASDVSIKYLQYFLKSQGFYQGIINGTNTESTITALFEWQKANNVLSDPSDPAAWYLGPKTRDAINPLLKTLLNS